MFRTRTTKDKKADKLLKVLKPYEPETIEEIKWEYDEKWQDDEKKE